MGVHVVVFPLPMHGHFNPMLHLSAKLAALGITVTFITTHRTHSRVMSAVASLSMAEELVGRFKFVSISDGLAKDYNESSREGNEVVLDIIFGMSKVADEFDRLMEMIECENGPVSCVILDFMLLATLQHLITKRAIPTATFWTSSVPFMLFIVDLQKFIDEGYIPVHNGTIKQESEDMIIPSMVSGIPPLHSLDDIPHDFQSADPEFLTRMCSCKHMLLEVPWIFINAVEEMDAGCLNELKAKGMKVVGIGPLIPNCIFLDHGKQSNLEADAVRWLLTKKSAIYVSFGSMATLTMEQVKEIALGLEESGHEFLWSLRQNLAAEHEFFESFQERTKSRGLIVSWCPQLDVLRHEAVKGFLTHCGWNSLVEGICAGVPMIGWPCLAEQNLNCKFMEDVWKIGIRLKRSDRSDIVLKSQISDAVKTLMQSDKGKQLKKQVSLLRDAARKSITDDGSSTRNLNSFADALKSLARPAKFSS